jgi:hypothetical protein
LVSASFQGTTTAAPVWIVAAMGNVHRFPLGASRELINAGWDLEHARNPDSNAD